MNLINDILSVGFNKRVQVSKKPHRSFDNDGKETSKEKALRRKINEQDREIKRLKGELKTLNDYFKKTASYVSTKTKTLSVEELIEGAKKYQSLEEITDNQDNCTSCGSNDIFKGKIPSGTLIMCRTCKNREVLNE